MLVVSDSSPINYLVLIDCVDILPKLFKTVIIPSMVADELSRPEAPAAVRSFVARMPAWLESRVPTRTERFARLQAGEEAAINLAIETNADLILLDDRDGRSAAQQRGLRVTGLLGVLERAAERELIHLPEVLGRLPAAFRIDRALIEDALARDAARRKA